MGPSNLTQMDQSFSQTFWCFSIAYYKTKCPVLVHSPQSVTGAVLLPCGSAALSYGRGLSTGFLRRTYLFHLWHTGNNMELHCVTVLFPHSLHLSVDDARHAGKHPSAELLKVSLSKTKHKRRANTVEFSEKTPVSLCSIRPNPLTDVGGGRIGRPWLQCFLGSYCFLNRKQPAQPSALHAIVFSIVQIFH